MRDAGFIITMVFISSIKFGFSEFSDEKIKNINLVSINSK